MVRVTSFNALESPPLYYHKNNSTNNSHNNNSNNNNSNNHNNNNEEEQRPHRLMRHLRCEKRKHLGKLIEFPGLRMIFTREYMKKLVANAHLRSGSF